MHDNILAVIAAMKVLMSVSSSISSNVIQLVSYKDFPKVLYNSKMDNIKKVL